MKLFKQRMSINGRKDPPFLNTLVKGVLCMAPFCNNSFTFWDIKTAS